MAYWRLANRIPEYVKDCAVPFADEWGTGYPNSSRLAHPSVDCDLHRKKQRRDFNIGD
jgi:hypothetical protein